MHKPLRDTRCCAGKIGIGVHLSVYAAALAGKHVYESHIQNLNVIGRSLDARCNYGGARRPWAPEM